MELAKQGQGSLDFQLACVITADKHVDPTGEITQDFVSKRQTVARMLSYVHGKAEQIHKAILKCSEKNLKQTLNQVRS